jgi:hypothetical protein
MAQLRYPSFQDTARVGSAGTLQDFAFKVFENPVNPMEGSLETGPEITDATPVVTLAMTGAPVPMVYNGVEYVPAQAPQVAAGNQIIVSLPDSEGASCNVVVVQVQPAA